MHHVAPCVDYMFGHIRTINENTGVAGLIVYKFQILFYLNFIHCVIVLVDDVQRS